MIPKRIFMIWLGNVVPAYASTSVSLFSKEYSDYDIEFIKYKINDLRKVRDGHIRSDIDGILAECMHEIFDIGDSSAYSAYIKNQLTIYGKSMRNIILLSDMFRLGLLNTFGGIYVDVDSSPVKRFDERLMSNERFCVCRQPYGKTFPDNYFMG